MTLTHFGDKTINLIVDWLDYYDVNHQEYMSDKESELFYSFKDKDYSIQLGGKELLKSKEFLYGEKFPFTSVWFRRPYDLICPTYDYNYIGLFPEINISHAVKRNFETFSTYLHYKLSQKHYFGSKKSNTLNKLIVLEKAMDLGLTVPKTLVTNKFEELMRFFNECNQSIISKPLYEIINDHHAETEEGEHIFLYQITKLIDKLDNDLPKVFAPSLFQENIDKEYEIRSIFLNGKIYSTAMFSQLNEETKVDVRNRQANEVVRYVNYQLPKHVEEGLIKLHEDLDLSYGAADILKAKDGTHYFLETNPVGQFGDVSHRGNYNLDKLMAEYLIDMN